MKRILFVDDEPNILEGLQRMLRPCRKEWEMAFAASGHEALRILAAEAYDVIVTDMRMPEMDGAQLLQLVREEYPGMIRIVLSGQFEIEAAMRVVQAAHQFLAKPCDVAKLKAVIERSCQGDELVFDAATRAMIAAIGELPPLPDTYAALVGALNDPQTSLDQVGLIIERDVAVAAKVLQLVNSALFGLSREIATVPLAAGYLGFDVLKQLVLTVELFRSFACRPAIRGVSVEELQRHSRCVAGLAAHLPVAQRDMAATPLAALLHDVGKLILMASSTGSFERDMQAALSEKRPLYRVEEEMHGTSHAEIGAYLLGLWGLPISIVGGVARHHHPVRNPEQGNLSIDCAVHLADLLIHEAEGEPLDRESMEAEFAEWRELFPDLRESARQVVQRESSL